jgi:serine/threonine protein kinase
MPTYTFVSEISRGGFGRVVKVKDEHGALFAMKLLEPSAQMAQVPIEQLKKRFEREVKYQQSISHPNVVKIHDMDMNANPPYCVMELAEGTLADDIAQDHTLGGDPKSALFDILNGLEFLAEQGFIHRDLKPQNVLKLRNLDGAIRYAISDFGLMRPGNSDTTTLTVTGAQGGTQNYAAPELMQDFSRATTAADIYAFGAILHETSLWRSRAFRSPNLLRRALWGGSWSAAPRRIPGVVTPVSQRFAKTCLRS